MPATRLARAIATVAALGALAACADDFIADPAAGRDATVLPVEWPARLILGETRTLRVDVVDVASGEHVLPAALAWSTQPSAIVQVVHSAGDSAVVRVTALGTAVVSAALQDPAFDTAATTAALDALLATIDLIPASGDTLASLGDTAWAHARGIDASGADVRVTGWSWSVAGPAASLGAVAADSAGAVAAANGLAWIVATHPLCAEACRDSVAVVVRQDAAQLTVTPDSARLAWIGDTIHLAATVRDARGNEAAGGVTWSSSAPGIASVDAGGVLRALGNGMADVIAAAGDFRDTVRVTVQQAVATIELPTAADTLAVGDTLRPVAVARDSGGTAMPDVALTWTTTDSTVASVDDSGRVAAHARGRATIRASAQGASAAIELLVAAWALEFGGDDYVEAAAAPAFVLPDSAFTLEVWVRPHTASASAALLGVWSGSKVSSAFALHLNGLVPVASLREAAGNGIVTIAAPAGIGTDAWHHIALVVDHGTGTLYVDGAAVAADSALPALSMASAPLRMGADMQPAPAFLDGELDEVRIWGVARSAAQIAAAMSTRIDPVATPGLRAYWPLASGSGDPVSLVGGMIGVRGGASGAAAAPAWTIEASPAP